MDDSQYTVGWICALPHELAASKAMLDKTHNSSPSTLLDDNNIYTRGKIQDHNVVIACLPAGNYGIGSAAISATHMKRSFPSIEFALLVGIGGAVPGSKHNIQLGDVVVSKPTQDHGGVIQYDIGKTLADGSFERRGYLNKPPKKLLNAINNLYAEYEMNGSSIPKYLHQAFERYPKMRATYSKPPKEALDSGLSASNLEFGGLDSPSVHYGLIASGNRVISNTEARDRLTQNLDILCFEMEAAGLDDLSCLVIRGISDFADESKNDDWKRYAAITAAAYAKELLITIRPLPAPRRNIYEEHDSLGVASRLRAMLVKTDKPKDIDNISSENGSRIFRIQNIPANMDRLDLINLISSLEKLALSVGNVEVLSLARTYSPYETRRTKVATVRFSHLPLALRDGKNQWTFKAGPRFSTQSDLILDTHFHGFTPLCDPSEEESAVDCIAIAGVGHHPYESWSSSNSNFMYLRDQMPMELPSLRVLLYGLETDVALYSSIEDISRLLAMDLRILRPASTANRPTIFLAHSLSGVILKYSLVQMAQSIDMENFLGGIEAIVYFGVPMAPMEAADIVAMSQYVAPNGLMNVLSSQNEMKDVHDQFLGAALLRNIQVFLVYEIHATNGAQPSNEGTWQPSPEKKILVPSLLAIPSGSEQNRIIPLKQHHHNLTRFEENSPSCYLITNVLKTASKHISNTGDNTNTSSNEPGAVPNPPSQHENTSNYVDPLMEPVHPSLPQYDKKHWSTLALYMEHLDNLMMRSLRFENDEQRYKQVTDATSSTFEWAFSSDDCDLLPWLKSSTGAFWITGRPGSGKSTFMKFIVEHEITRRILGYRSRQGTLVSAQFFFHGRGSSSQRSFEGLLQSTIYQMLSKQPELQQFVRPIFCRRPLSFWELWSFDELEEAFERVCQNKLSIKIFLFLDALDEYSGTKTVICDFIRKYALSSSNACICFSSRPWNIFKEHFQDIPSIRIHERTQQDIAIFTDRMITGRPPLSRLNSTRVDGSVSENQSLHEHIQSRAKGVFLWVALVLNVLEQRAIDGITHQNALELLDELPDELDVFYDHIISSIPSKYREEAYIIFETVLRSTISVSLELVQAALLLARASTIQECFKAISQKQFSHSVVERIISSRCGGLVEYSTRNDGAVQFMHHTVFEYFKAFSASRCLSDQASIRVLGTGHSILTKVFLTQLERIRLTYRPDIVELLTSHVQAAERTTGLSQYVLLRSVPESSWARWYSLISHMRQDSFSGKSFANLPNATIFAVSEGLELYLCEELAMCSHNKTKQRGQSSSNEVLSALPIIFGYMSFETQLEETGKSHFQFIKFIFDICKPSWPSLDMQLCFGDCLHIGISLRPDGMEHNFPLLGIIEGLLEHGQDPNQIFELDFLTRFIPFRGHPFPWTFLDENAELVPWITKAFTGTAVHLAALNSSERIMSLLLKYGANVNAKDSLGRTPLDWAFATSNNELFKQPWKGTGLQSLENTCLYRCRFRVEDDSANDDDGYKQFNEEEPVLKKYFGTESFLNCLSFTDSLPSLGGSSSDESDEPITLNALRRVRNWRIVEIPSFNKSLISLLEAHGAVISNYPDIHGQSPIYDASLKGWCWPLTRLLKDSNDH